MSEIKVNSIKGVGASTAAITVNNTDGTCIANVTNNLSNRRINVNGAMQVAQRGTVTGITSSTYAGPDRFRFGVGSHGTFTVSQDSSAPTGSGFANSLKLACTTADTSVAASTLVYFQHKLEGQDCQRLKKGTSSAEPLAVQFWVKSNKTGTYAFQCSDNDNSRSFTTTYTISSADTWEKKEIVIPADTTGVLDDNNLVSLTFNFWLAVGTDYSSGSASSTWYSYVNANAAVGHAVNIADSTSNTWYMTGLQMETGSVHTDFEHRSFGQELALCQRYCFVWKSNQSYSVWGTGYMTHSTGVDFSFTLPQTMRASPSFSSSGSFRLVGYENDTQYAQALSSFSMTRSHTLTPYLRGVISGGVGGAVGELSDNGSNNATATFSAEL